MGETAKVDQQRNQACQLQKAFSSVIFTAKVAFIQNLFKVYVLKR